jgi:putative transposase
VAIVSERGTSKTCHRCGEEGRRPHQGLFKCPSCRLEYNADLNGAINIAKRFSEQCLEDGAAFDTALNSGVVKPCKVDQSPENLPASVEESVEQLLLRGTWNPGGLKRLATER